MSNVLPRRPAVRAERLREVLATRDTQDLIPNIVAFGHLLKEAGLDITVSRVIDAMRSLGLVDLGERQAVRLALRSNFASTRAQQETFDRLFALFFASGRGIDDEEGRPVKREEAEPPPGAEEAGEEPGPEEARSLESLEEWLDELPDDTAAQEQPRPSYSPDEVLVTRDFGTFTDQELKEARRAVERVARLLATRLSRRRRPDPRGRELDLRRTFRRNIKYLGETIELMRRRRRKRRTRVVLLCDVSGSMDLYSRFLIQFLYGLQNALPDVETLVFSTRLTRVTGLLRRRGILRGLKDLAATVADWSGGTNIGHCLRVFNTWFAKSLLTRRSIVIIISDGWDRGDAALLAGEMRRLKMGAFKVIWLNPLLGSPNYQPLCQGMRAALPFTDYFLPVHNLQSLLALGRTLVPLVA